MDKTIFYEKDRSNDKKFQKDVVIGLNFYKKSIEKGLTKVISWGTAPGTGKDEGKYIFTLILKSPLADFIK